MALAVEAGASGRLGGHEPTPFRSEPPVAPDLPSWHHVRTVPERGQTGFPGQRALGRTCSLLGGSCLTQPTRVHCFGCAVWGLGIRFRLSRSSLPPQPHPRLATCPHVYPLLLNTFGCCSRRPGVQLSLFGGFENLLAPVRGAPRWKLLLSPDVPASLSGSACIGVGQLPKGLSRSFVDIPMTYRSRGREDRRRASFSPSFRPLAIIAKRVP